MKAFVKDKPSSARFIQNKDITILVADRNPHVRDFLRREMMSEGFHVGVARNASEVIKHVYQDESIDLVVIDPDLPDIPQEELLSRLLDRIPGLPIVVHAFSFPNGWPEDDRNRLAFVKKEGESIDRLKEVVMRLVSRLTWTKGHRSDPV